MTVAKTNSRYLHVKGFNLETLYELVCGKLQSDITACLMQPAMGSYQSNCASQLTQVRRIHCHSAITDGRTMRKLRTRPNTLNTRHAT